MCAPPRRTGSRNSRGFRVAQRKPVQMYRHTFCISSVWNMASSISAPSPSPVGHCRLQSHTSEHIMNTQYQRRTVNGIVHVLQGEAGLVGQADAHAEVPARSRIHTHTHVTVSSTCSFYFIPHTNTHLRTHAPKASCVWIIMCFAGFRMTSSLPGVISLATTSPEITRTLRQGGRHTRSMK